MNGADIATSVVAVIHAGFAVVELFLWQLPFVHRRLNFSATNAAIAAPVVRNAGLYNSFLAVALAAVVFMTHYPPEIRTYLLACAIIAGLFGAITLKWTVFVFQSLPAIVALALWLTHVV